MASAKPGVHILTLNQVQVDQRLVQGEKFIKWTDQVKNIYVMTFEIVEILIFPLYVQMQFNENWFKKKHLEIHS